MRLLRAAPSTYSCVIIAVVALLFLASAVYGWTGPTASPPNSNVAAPINVSSIDQTKDAALGVNGLAVFGNTLLSGSGRYLNWGSTAGLSGYGLRDNGGTIEYKNSGGNWTSLSTSLGWVVSGNNIYNANSGNVGIGTASPGTELQVSGSGETELTVTGTANGYINAGIVLSALDDDVNSRGAGIFMHDAAADNEWFAGRPYGGSDQYIIARATGLPSHANLIAQSTYRLMSVSNTGTVNATAFLYTSDERLKEAIQPLKDSLAKLLKLNPVSFVWRDGAHKGEEDIGFIAQEVEQVVPEVVHTGADGIKAIDYPKLVPILVKATQEEHALNQAQQDEIDALRDEVRALRDQ